MSKTAIKLTFEESILGSQPSNDKVFSDFIASKAPDAATIEDEIAAVGAAEVVDKSMTIFPRLDGKPAIYDYQVKGFFKDACSMLKRVPGTYSSKLKAYKKEIDGLVFVQPRLFEIKSDKPMGVCERPLRAQTMQGERVALAISEEIPAGATCEFEVTLLRDDMWPLLEEWLDYGALRGLGQWRNGSHGKFSYEVID